MKKALLSFILIFSALSILSAQYPRGGGGRFSGGFGKRPSGTSVSQAQKDFMKLHKIAITEFDDSTSRGLIEFPIKVHIVSKSDGTEGVSIQEVKDALRSLNDYFLKAYIRFVPLPDYNYIKDDELYKLKLENEDVICKKHDVRNVINLYVNSKLQGERNSYCGYTHMPDKINIDRVFITKKCLNNGASLIRQFGHYFSLYPTSGPDEGMRSEELVDGSNCNLTGDEICDTPADPGLTLQTVDSRCEFVGTQQDAMSKFYRPMTTNIMSDNPRYECRRNLTKEQYRRIMYAATYIRNYLEFPVPTEINKKFQKSLENQYGVKLKVDLKIDARSPGFLSNSNLYKIRGIYEAGTNYTISITNFNKGYVYVFEGDDERGLNLVYPKSGDQQFFKGGKEFIHLPMDADAFDIDDKNRISKTNYICVMYSRKQLPVKNFIRAVNEHSNSSLTLFQRFYAAHEDIIVANKNLEYKNSRLEVDGLTVDRPIVPIFIEYEQY
jgi:hypothetical protein